jgi:hypothetical protein
MHSSKGSPHVLFTSNAQLRFAFVKTRGPIELKYVNFDGETF